GVHVGGEGGRRVVGRADEAVVLEGRVVLGVDLGHPLVDAHHRRRRGRCRRRRVCEGGGFGGGQGLVPLAGSGIGAAPVLGLGRGDVLVPGVGFDEGHGAGSGL